MAKRNRSSFRLRSLGYWEPRAFKSGSTVSKVQPVIKPVMAAEWEILVPVQSVPRPKPVNASPAEARLSGVSKKSVNAWRAPSKT
jgi:hypothetical protein